MSEPDYCEGYYPKSCIDDGDRKAAARILREAVPPEPCDDDDPLQDGWLLLGLDPIERAAQVAVEGCDGGGMSWGELYELLAALIEPDPPKECRRRWSGDSHWRCTLCGAFVAGNAVTDCMGAIPARYCPNCGAEIREDTDD